MFIPCCCPGRFLQMVDYVSWEFPSQRWMSPLTFVGYHLMGGPGVPAKQGSSVSVTGLVSTSSVVMLLCVPLVPKAVSYNIRSGSPPRNHSVFVFTVFQCHLALQHIRRLHLQSHPELPRNLSFLSQPRVAQNLRKMPTWTARASVGTSSASLDSATPRRAWTV